MAEMDVMIIPGGGQECLMLPQSLVSRIYPYAPPLSVEQASEFVVGSLLVENEKVPVLDFVFTVREKPYEGGYRMVLVKTITNQSMFHRYALVSYGEPEIIHVGDAQLQKITGHYHPLVAQCLALEGRDDMRVMVLDLPEFESELKIA